MQENNLTELDISYLPNKWSKRLCEGVVAEKHVEVCKNQSYITRRKLQCELNLSYGSMDREKYDMFGTDLNDNGPIFVFLHGGYWQIPVVTRDLYGFIAEQFYKKNIRTIIIDYELCPKVTVAEIIERIECAMRKVFDYAHQHKSRGLYLAGHSAGAHLILSLFIKFTKTLPHEDQELLKGAFLLCGVYDLRKITETCLNQVLNLDQKSAESVSPLLQEICPGTETRFLVMSAENDPPALKNQALQMHDKLIQSGIQSQYFLIKEVDHFDFIEKLVDEDYEVTKLLIQNMTCAAAAK